MSYLKSRYILILFYSIYLSLLCSCHTDQKNISIKGKITDEFTNQGIANAEVLVLCWKSENFDKISLQKHTLFTDSEGNYGTSCERAYQVDIAAQKLSYNPVRSYNVLGSRKSEINLKLTQSKENRSLVKQTNQKPFLSVKIYLKQDLQTLDLNRIETFGFDFTSLTIKPDLSNVDFSFKVETNGAQAKTLITPKKGGLIPIYSDEIKSSPLYEKSIAPTNGYASEYILKGTEVGFFILSRDGKTYAKIILEKSLVEISHSDLKGSYKEFGMNFSYLYQPNGTTDLTYSNDKVDLESFLID